MKKLFNFLLVLLIGAALGYVFHNPIDAKLKAKFGSDKVETVRAETEKTLRNGSEKAVEVGKAMVEAGKEELDSAKNEK